MVLLPVTLVNKADPYLGVAPNTDSGWPQGNPGHNYKDTPIAFMQSSSDTNINCVAWIAATDTTAQIDSNGFCPPRMPKLVASSGSIPGLTYCWRLQVTFHDRQGNPHRDFDSVDPNDLNGSAYLLIDPYYTTETTTDMPDQITIPANSKQSDPTTWRQISDGSPWRIYKDPDWMAAAGEFFGGDALLSLTILDNGGKTIMPEQDYRFRIAGENPAPTTCKAYINANNQGNWFAYAIAKEETNGEGGRNYYNQFLDNGGLAISSSGKALNKHKPWPGHEGRPNWYDDGTDGSYGDNGNVIGRWTQTGGYGLFQVTREASNPSNGANGAGSDPDPDYIQPRGRFWNWQENALAGLTEIQSKRGPATALYNGLLATYQGSGPIPNHLSFSGLDSIIITMYNGIGGGKITRIPVKGYKNNPATCWFPTTGGWEFLPNWKGYVDKVNANVEH